MSHPKFAYITWKIILLLEGNWRKNSIDEVEFIWKKWNRIFSLINSLIKHFYNTVDYLQNKFFNKAKLDDICQNI